MASPPTQVPARLWPLELIDAIVGASCDTANPLSTAATRSHLITSTYVSHSFYMAARRRLWETVTIKHSRGDQKTSSLRNTSFYDIIRDNPALRAVIRTVRVEIRLLQADGGQQDPNAQITDQAPEGVASEHTSFTKALCLLATSNVAVFSLFVPRLRTSMSFPAVDALEDDVLFALTAIRTSPSLISFNYWYIRGAPPSLLFGDPMTDSVRRVTFKGEFPSANSFRDYTVPRDSPSFDLSDDAYRTTSSAISYFATGGPNPGLPLLPKMTQLELMTGEGGLFLMDCLAQQPAVDPSAPLNGHVPALEDLTWNASFQQDPQSEINTLLNARGGQLTRFASADTFVSRAISSLANLKQVSTLSFGAALPLPGIDYDQNEEDRDEETGVLATLTRLLATIPPSHPLKTLSITFDAYAGSIEEFGDQALGWTEFWSPLDRAIERVGDLLSRNVAVKVELAIDVTASTLEEYMEAVEELRELEDGVQAILPLCKASRYIDLTIEARVLRE